MPIFSFAQLQKFAAQNSLSKDASPEVSQKAAQHNQALSLSRGALTENSELQANVLRPYADYENVKSLIFSGHNNFGEAKRVKGEMIKNLPEGVQVVIYDSLGNPEAGLKDLPFYSEFIELIRITRMLLQASSVGFWSRDAIPVPVFRRDGGVAAVDAKYYRNFEPDAEFGRKINVPILKHDYYHEGGNFLADRQGRCLIVDNIRAVKIPNTVFESLYGCTSVHRFKQLKGIGHIDERVKLVSDTEAMTDMIEYVPQLEAMGFRVTLLPQGDRYYETYANSILINGSVFLPVFRQSKDAEAIAAYEELGLKVFPIYVRDLPNQGNGSLHCITMTFPDTTFPDTTFPGGSIQ